MTKLVLTPLVNFIFPFSFALSLFFTGTKHRSLILKLKLIDSAKDQKPLPLKRFQSFTHKLTFNAAV